MRQVGVMTVQALPYHRALKAWPVCFMERAPMNAWVSSFTAMSPNSRNSWGWFRATQMAAAPWVSLSARGSSIFPRSVTMSNRRAICPSRMSEAAETPNTMRAARVRPFQ